MRCEAAALVPSTATKALVMAIEILAGSNGEREPLRRTTWRSIGDADRGGNAEGIEGIGDAWAAMDRLLGLRKRCEKTADVRPFGGTKHCHLASPRRRQRMFPRQVFGLTGSDLLA
jgi:hypothetical protein